MAEDSIAAIMQTDYLTLAPDTPIREATARLTRAQASAAPVVDASGRLVGILTEKDCFRPALNASYYQQWDGTVAGQMSPDPATLDAETDVVTAANAFLDHPYRCFPVTSNGELVGMLDRAHLLGVFLRYG